MSISIFSFIVNTKFKKILLNLTFPNNWDVLNLLRFCEMIHSKTGVMTSCFWNCDLRTLKYIHNIRHISFIGLAWRTSEFIFQDYNKHISKRTLKIDFHIETPKLWVVFVAELTHMSWSVGISERRMSLYSSGETHLVSWGMLITADPLLFIQSRSQAILQSHWNGLSEMKNEL